ncbi:hypothetical protein LC092_05455 [Stappia stellulata]|uniref:hypothetical protein n=1 Tax=Stappia stellulata TaxID=71235 RepID=UPI001CD5A3CD|nr:hypothetical protein [Stappia stellulata]MCA1241874.1 hypothetical protein [Stappia stellulata]
MTLFLTEAANGRDESFVEAAPRTRAEMEQRERARRDSDFQRYSEIFRANDEAQTYTQNATNLLERRRRAYDERIEAVRAATGVELENPLRVARWPTMDELKARGPDENIVATRKRLFAERLHALQTQYPDKADRIRAGLSIDDQARQLGRDIEVRADAVNADPDNPGGSGLAGFAGTVRGYLRDPLQLGTLFVGGPEGGAAVSIAGRILTSFGRNAAINAGVETVLQVPAQMGRAEAGLEAGVAEGAKNVGLAAGLGGALGGAMTGIGEMIRAGRAAPKDVAAVRDALDPETRTEFDMAIEAGRDEAAAFADPPAGVTPEEAGRLATEAVDQIADDGPPVSGAVEKPARAPDVAQILDKAADAPSGAVAVQGKPARFSRFDPATLETDAAAYQYKGGGDATGVTDRLSGVQSWDATASGKVFVHERSDGTRYVADGHQRLGLAKRLKSEGDDAVVLDGYLFREADGWGVADVRALAAKKNMQEGSGSPLDAARILRDSPDLLDDSLPVSGPMMRKAIGLSRLSDDAFGMTVNGMIPENHAALVGEMVTDPALHAGVLQDLQRFAPETDRQARLLIGESLSSGRQVEVQNDMFGAFRMERTLMGERVKVLDAALKALRSDKRLFATLADNAEVIEAAGNRLDTGGNEARAATAEMVGELLDRMARTRGPVSDALSAAARQVAEGAKPGPAARKFVGDVRDMIDEGGLGRLLAPPEPELKPAATVEPGSSEAARAGDELEPVEPTAAELEEAGQGSMWDMLPDGVDAEGNQRFTTADELTARATRDEDLADLVKSCKD